jgi:hypothetical protein
MLPMERREIDGRCASYFATKVYPFLREGFEAGTLRIIVQLADKHTEIPDLPIAMISSATPQPVLSSIFWLCLFRPGSFHREHQKTDQPFCGRGLVTLNFGKPPKKLV